MAKRGRRVRKPRAQHDSDVSGSSSAEEFEQEYAYVLKDLRRVFALAAVMFVLLIALNLVLQ
jgi:hypothetical protein